MSNSQNFSLQELPERRKKPLSILRRCGKRCGDTSGIVTSTLTASTRKSGSPRRIFQLAVFSLTNTRLRIREHSRSETWPAQLWLELALMVREDKRLPARRERKRTVPRMGTEVFFLHLFPFSLGHNDNETNRLSHDGG